MKTFHICSYCAFSDTNILHCPGARRVKMSEAVGQAHVEKVAYSLSIRR